MGSERVQSRPRPSDARVSQHVVGGEVIFRDLFLCEFPSESLQTRIEKFAEIRSTISDRFRAGPTPSDARAG